LYVPYSVGRVWVIFFSTPLFSSIIITGGGFPLCGCALEGLHRWVMIAGWPLRSMGTDRVLTLRLSSFSTLLRCSCCDCFLALL
ncbi:hypothetical protein LINPERHAP1_LOCUS389, partial [Linum perenne]